MAGSLFGPEAPHDHADITALRGNRVVLEAVSAIARSRGEDSPRPHHHR